MMVLGTGFRGAYMSFFLRASCRVSLQILSDECMNSTNNNHAKNWKLKNSQPDVGSTAASWHEHTKSEIVLNQSDDVWRWIRPGLTTSSQRVLPIKNNFLYIQTKKSSESQPEYHSHTQQIRMSVRQRRYLLHISDLETIEINDAWHPATRIF